MKIALAIGISLFVGIGLATFMQSTSETGVERNVAGNADDFFDASAATEERLRALELALTQERNARQLLEEELQILFERLDEQGAAASAAGTGNFAAPARSERSTVTSSRDMRSPENRSERLVQGGFSTDRADWIVRREAELQVEAMRARYEARQSGEAFDPLNPALNPAAALRSELGDAEYERYLEAQGQPTSVFVRSVLASSPGETAGLQPGDRITSYGGERVFDMLNLNQRIMQGEPGTDVVVDIERNGVPMQIVMPSGPIGARMSRPPRR